MNFGLAIEASKKGEKIARKGWNGKGMFVYHIPGGNYVTQTEVAKKEFGEVAHYSPYLAIKTVSDSVSTWVPSINDVLAEDWEAIK